MGNPVLDSLDESLDLAKKEKDPVWQFQVMMELSTRAHGGKSKMEKKVKKFEKEMHEMRDEHAFISRHRHKLDALTRAMRHTYANPKKTLLNINNMIGQYGIEYVLEIARRGAFRLGPIQGMGFLGIKSDTRSDAEENYVKYVLPALEQILPDQLVYLELVRQGVPEKFEELQEMFGKLVEERTEFETKVEEIDSEMRAIATSMSEEVISRLNEEQQMIRTMLLPEKP